MPNISVSIYVDHQEVIAYPVRYICSKLHWAEHIYIHCGDAKSLAEVDDCQSLMPGVITTHIIDHKVRSPGDIAAARNKCWDWLQHNCKSDWIVFLSADTLPTQATYEVLVSLAEQNVQCMYHVPTHQVVLYVDLGCSPWGCAIVSRTNPGRWIGDGSYCGPGGDPYIPRVSCLHLGYLGIDAIGRHQTQHATTWSTDALQERARLYRTDRRGFVLSALRDLRDGPPEGFVHSATPPRRATQIVLIDEPEFWREGRLGPHDCPQPADAKYLSDEYEKVVGDLGLRDERELVRALVQELGRTTVNP